MSKNEKPENGAVSKSQIALTEEKILDFWNEKGIFIKTLEQTKNGKNVVFYDGPPFATGLPHYGHILPGTMKDVIPRYQTMKGNFVARRWGWDCHGLPVENLIEKELGITDKRQIEEFGIEKFNTAAKDSVLRYEQEWKRIVPRSGRFIDMENAYMTMQPTFTESVWWGFSELYKKNLAYEGFKSMHLCPRCETTLSNFEVNQGYKDITDISVYVLFEKADEPGTYFMAWTTTPWTLPGNVALAVNSDIDYMKMEFEADDTGKYSSFIGKSIIIADTPETRNNIFGENGGYLPNDLSRYSIPTKEGNVLFNNVEVIPGKYLVGSSYTPVFKYFSETVDNKENGWKVYAADFVTTEDGTGIVHIAPAFGDDDYNLGRENSLPFIQHVTPHGVMIDEVTDFKGLFVKPKDDHQATDIEIIKYLAHNGALYAKEKIIHSYPHCYRCETPLINYATASWFIKVTDFKDKLVKANQTTKWVPESIKDKRFGNWLEGAKDWSVSRSRFWGAPLPVWKSENGTIETLGSLDELKNKTRTSGKFFVMRHGEADHNVENIMSSDNSVVSHLTEKGKGEVLSSAQQLKDTNITRIFVSPLIRTQETTALVAAELGIPESSIVTDERLKEVQGGDFNGKSVEEYRSYFKDHYEKMEKTTPGKNGETLQDMKNRLGDFLYEINKKYPDENILIVTHEYTSWMLSAASKGLDKKKSAELKDDGKDFIKTGDFIELDFAPIPHNKNYELDFHRPYIDEITWMNEKGEEMRRIPDVFDTWVDSGSMSFAQHHFPFSFEGADLEEKKKSFKEKYYPADFIAEGLDQTRGWFYTLLVMGVSHFDEAPFRNVVVNGMLLAGDGRKMSKSLRNYPPIDEVFDKYGADALRYYLMASPLVKSEEVNFSEKGVDEVMKKITMRFYNVLSFYEMYGGNQKAGKATAHTENILDAWMVSRVGDVRNQVTSGLDNYEFDKATRPFMDLVDDLSTWYLRRSRDRFKEENEDMAHALQTTKWVLIEMSKLFAPTMPFMAEEVYQRVKDSDMPESVHLCSWPAEIKVDEKVLSNMKVVREVVSEALEVRSKSQIKVRQPLQSVTIASELVANDPALSEILKDELNVKEVHLDKNATEIVIDTNITEALGLEGQVRDLIRGIQALRKAFDLKPSDIIKIDLISDNQETFINIKSYEEEIKRLVGALSIDSSNESNNTTALDIGNDEYETRLFIRISKLVGDNSEVLG